MEPVIGEEIDLTEDTDDEISTHKGEHQPSWVGKSIQENKTVALVDLSKLDENKHTQQNWSSTSDETPIAVKSMRNYEKLMDKAIEEIKKGGSLKSVSVLYNIPEEALYQKLVSRSLPKEAELLTAFEENNLVRWILRSNENNIVVTKQNLMERVGKMKKVLRITPIFCRSKFGKMWYDYFLKTYSEVFELEGIILPSPNCRQVYAKRLRKATTNNSPRKEKQKVSRKENIDLAALYGVKEVKIILQDFRKLKSFEYTDEGDGCYTPVDSLKSKVNLAESIVNQNSDEEFRGFESEVNKNTRLMGKDISNIFTLERETSPRCDNYKQEDRTCEICNKEFHHPTKLEKHLRLHHNSKQELPFTCYKCMKGFSTKSKCTHHMQMVHRRKKMVKCVICRTFFKNQASLSFHIREHHKCGSNESTLDCVTCNKEFSSRRTLEEHVMYVHLNKEKPFSCEFCGQGFLRPSIMAQHRLKHKQMKSLPCPCCSKVFFKKHLLQKHIDICLTKGNRRTNEGVNKEITDDAGEDIIIID